MVFMIFLLKVSSKRSIPVLYRLFKGLDKMKYDLFEILKDLNLDGKDLRILRNLYWEQEAAIRIDSECSPFEPICSGVRQGCVLSPDLFDIYSEMILRNTYDHGGVKVGGQNINNLRYADDTVLIADTEDQLQRTLKIVAEESEAKGLELKAKKTECMVISKKQEVPTCNISCKEENIKQVTQFKYLGFMLTPDARCSVQNEGFGLLYCGHS